MTRTGLTVGRLEVVARPDSRIDFPTHDFFQDVPSESLTPYRGQVASAPTNRTTSRIFELTFSLGL